MSKSLILFKDSKILYLLNAVGVSSSLCYSILWDFFLTFLLFCIYLLYSDSIRKWILYRCNSLLQCIILIFYHKLEDITLLKCCYLIFSNSHFTSQATILYFNSQELLFTHILLFIYEAVCKLHLQWASISIWKLKTTQYSLSTIITKTYLYVSPFYER